MIPILELSFTGNDWYLMSNAKDNWMSFKSMRRTDGKHNFTGMLALSSIRSKTDGESARYGITLSVLAEDQKGSCYDLFERSLYSSETIGDLAKEAKSALEEAMSTLMDSQVNPVFFTYDVPLCMSKGKTMLPLTDQEKEQFAALYKEDKK